MDGSNIFRGSAAAAAENGGAVGFALAILILAGIREKIAHNNIPKAFRGMPITLICAGLMAIAFFGFKSLA